MLAWFIEAEKQLKNAYHKKRLAYRQPLFRVEKKLIDYKSCCSAAV